MRIYATIDGYRAGNTSCVRLLGTTVDETKEIAVLYNTFAVNLKLTLLVP